MPDDRLADLLARNASHLEERDAKALEAVQDGQSPPVVSLCCSDSRVSQEGMFAVDEPGTLFTPSNIGNQARVRHEGEDIVDGNLLYPLAHTGTGTAVVVGHTGCGAVTAAYQAATGKLDLDAEPPGIRRMVAQLVPVVEEALSDLEAGSDGVVHDLVERNVDAQVAFLLRREEVPDEVAVVGMVYDLHGVYGDEPGAVYLTNADGVTDVEALRDRVPDGFARRVRRRTGPGTP